MLIVFSQEGIWGGVIVDNGARRLVTARVQPGYVTCTPQGRLPGCLFKFDDLEAQCRTGRQGRCLYMYYFSVTKNCRIIASTCTCLTSELPSLRRVRS